jgi:hypothetical protein
MDYNENFSHNTNNETSSLSNVSAIPTITSILAQLENKEQETFEDACKKLM